MQSMRKIKQEVTDSDPDTARFEQSVPETAIVNIERATEANPTATLAQQHERQRESGGAMHPSRQQMVKVLGPLDEPPEPVVYKVSGANTQTLGQKNLPVQDNRGMDAMNLHRPVLPGPTASEAIQAAHRRSFQAVFPAPRALPLLDRPVPVNDGIRTIVVRDPRPRAQRRENQEVPSSPASARVSRLSGIVVKQEDDPRELLPRQAQPNQPQWHDVTSSSPLRLVPLRSQPVVYPSRSQEVQHVTFQQLGSDPASESESRIRELETENLDLRKENFYKDRQIRKLKAELLQKGIRSGSVRREAFEDNCRSPNLNGKRPRYDEGDAGGPVMAPSRRLGPHDVSPRR